MPAIVGAGLLVFAGCSSGSSGSGSSTPATQSGSTPAPAVNPLTGEGPASRHPVIAVKIEDTALGRPQVGTNKADIVYVEQVEGGLTRLMAIFNSSLPTAVEPVRSVRPSDPELALQFGHIIFVASGGSHAGIAPLLQSPLKKVINDNGAPGFHRDGNRVAPENLVANLQAVAKKVHGPTARSIGLQWSTQLPAGSKPGPVVATRVGGTDVGFRWDPKTHRYLRIIDGNVQHTADGSVISTPNVIVQFCKVTVYTKDRDVLGHPAQYTHTVGQGRVVVFRDGRRITGTWSRASVNDGTTLKTSGGKVIPLTPGGAWFVLVANGAPLQ
jgi:Protein of unknown function (DUF3048) N-terminal domain/Protein of unknown function (DUF3048) C-terminal domain